MLDVQLTTRAEQVDELLQTGALSEADFEVIYRHYHRPLTGFSARHGSLDPEGVANLALFDGYRAFQRNKLRSERAFRAYVYRAAQSRVIGEHRRPTPRPAVVAENDVAVDDGAEERADRSWLSGMIQELPNDQQRVITSRYLEGRSARETASELDRNPNAVHQLQHRAMQNLRRVAAAAAMACLLVAVLIAIDRFTADPTTVLNAPADSSDQTVEQTVPNRVDAEPTTQSLPETPAAAADGESRTVEPTVASSGPVEGQDENSEPSQNQDTPTAVTQTTETTATETIETTATETTETTATETTETTALQNTETTAIPTEPSPSVAVPGPDASPQPGDPLGGLAPAVCREIPTSQFISAFILFEAENTAQAAEFVRPEGVQFLVAGSEATTDIDVSIASPSGVQHLAFGWLVSDGDQLSVHRLPIEDDGLLGWGVLKDGRIVDEDWRSVRYQIVNDHGSLDWTPSVNCSP